MESFIKDEGFFFYRCSALARLVSLPFFSNPDSMVGVIFLYEQCVRAIAIGSLPFLESPNHLFDGDFLFYTLIITLIDNNLEVALLDYF
jgi:hypothetical protein